MPVNSNALMQQIMQQMMGMQQQPGFQNPLPPETADSLRQQKIAQAMSSAGNAMATTPGDFMTGIAAGAGAGAQSYHGSNDKQRDQMRDAEDDFRKQQLQRMAIMKSVLGGANTMADNSRADRSEARVKDNVQYQRGRDKKSDEISANNTLYQRLNSQNTKLQRKQEKDALAGYRTEQLLNSRYKALGLDDPDLFEDDRILRLKDYETYERRLRGGPGQKKKKQKAQIGATATGPNGEKITLTAEGWVPVQ